jgi:hypothetical protein
MITLNTVVISGIRTLADRGIRLTIDCPELPAQEMAEIFSSYKGGEPGITIKEIKTDVIKSPSTRLRNVLYRKWERTAMLEGFEFFYLTEMERIISEEKDKLI